MKPTVYPKTTSASGSTCTNSLLGMVMLVVGMFFAVSVCGSRESTAQAQPAGAGGAAGGTELTLELGDKVTLKLVQIPAGKFLMGSPEAEQKRAKAELRPAEVNRVKEEVQHEVTISKSFYMGIAPVTVDQFAAFVKDSKYQTTAEKDGWSFGIEIKDGYIVPIKEEGCCWREPGFEQKGDHPVVNISWNDATAFCAWLSRKIRKQVVLPTEAQWEYACRAGTKTAYPWGDNPDDGKGWANGCDQSYTRRFSNYPANMKFFTWDDGFVFTSPVEQFKANAYGLHDMNGNVMQWCQDRYGDYGKSAVTDPIGGDRGIYVLRGGSWSNVPRLCRSAARERFAPAWGNGDIGFRVAVVAGVN